MTASPQLRESVRDPDAKRLALIRARMAHWPDKMNFAVSGGTWSLEWHDPVTGELETLATFEPFAPPELAENLASAGATIRFLLALIDRATYRIRELQGKGGRAMTSSKDYAAECAMKCDDPLFRKYLEQMHGLEVGSEKEFVVGKVRQVLDIASRKELNAAQRWRDLVRDFDFWRANPDAPPPGLDPGSSKQGTKSL